MEIHAGVTLIEFEWISSEVILDLVDQHGNRLKNSRILVYGAVNWLSNPLTVVLPITDETVYPKIDVGNY